ncbi:hypothetical protein [Uliginosibacterium sp. TH139]|uniref:hypothetical protein n=1 Tax=Uliginosibacterium sp. TH139 TaxID=2067453 RepID=UPI000C79909F|nr:hypothetical protein [Uliginosibacterium sp. TH139]PLK50275.1 hypothetical protein C0V76_00105 [Uliginosibacterium sp. TH139]
MKRLLPLILLLLSACSEPLPADKEIYAGDWEGPGMLLSISSDGRLYYQRAQGSNSTSLDVPIQRFEGDNIVAGLGPASATFVVSQRPHPEQGEWVMVVDGVRLVRQE